MEIPIFANRIFNPDTDHRITVTSPTPRVRNSHTGFLSPCPVAPNLLAATAATRHF